MITAVITDWIKSSIHHVATPATNRLNTFKTGHESYASSTSICFRLGSKYIAKYLNTNTINFPITNTIVNTLVRTVFKYKYKYFPVYLNTLISLI